MQGLAAKIEQTAECLQQRWSGEPRVGLILGTGLGGLADAIDQQAVISYEDLPNFPKSTVEGHSGQLVCGALHGVPLLAMEGRFHYYEGYSLQEVTFPVRVMKACGVELLVVTNAAGGLNPQWSLGDIVLLDDHIDFLPDNPLRGVNDDALGPRYPDMLEPYDQALIAQTQALAAERGIPTQKGVVVAVAGPNLETRAEYRMLRMMGADVVTMSTVPEVIVAKHAGLRTLGFSIVTDMCLPDALEPVNIERIISVANASGEKLGRLIDALFQSWSNGFPTPV